MQQERIITEHEKHHLSRQFRPISTKTTECNAEKVESKRHTGATHLARRPEEHPTCRQERLRPRWQVLVEAARASSLRRRMGKRVRAGFSEALIGWAVKAGLYSVQLDILLDGPDGPLCLQRAVVVRSTEPLHRRLRAPALPPPSFAVFLLPVVVWRGGDPRLAPSVSGSFGPSTPPFLPVRYAARVSPTDCSRGARLLLLSR
jgi:hypothetical protein